jgi:hypothetical protein
MEFDSMPRTVLQERLQFFQTIGREAASETHINIDVRQFAE